MRHCFVIIKTCPFKSIFNASVSLSSIRKGPAALVTLAGWGFAGQDRANVLPGRKEAEVTWRPRGRDFHSHGWPVSKI